MLSYFMRSFPKMAEAVARVKEMGAIKYNDGNWRLGNKPDDEYWNSMFRHLNYINTGEDYDKDTGCLHIAHAVWNLCALLELNYPDLPARDDEIWADRAVHWAEEKRKREHFEAIETTEGFGAAFAAHLIEEEKSKREAKESTATLADSITYVKAVASVPGLQKELEKQKQKTQEALDAPNGSLEKFVVALESLEAKASNMLFTECPMCGHRVARMQTPLQGLECRACGEIFEVPIVPEGARFVDGAPRSPVLDRFMRLVATRDEVRSRHTPHCAEERGREAAEALIDIVFDDSSQDSTWYIGLLDEAEAEDVEAVEEFGPALAARWAAEAGERRRDDAVDAAIYANCATDFLCSKLDECPMCGSTAVWQGDCGRECRECGEVFEVPIVPENAMGPEMVRFGSDERRPIFVNMMAELFEASIVPAPEPIRFVIKDGERSQAFDELVAEYYEQLRRA
jgi:predicted RNA-binding Zn-ribbon protein involved in translation (DUF1610 family)